MLKLVGTIIQIEINPSKAIQVAEDMSYSTLNTYQTESRAIWITSVTFLKWGYL